MHCASGDCAKTAVDEPTARAAATPGTGPAMEWWKRNARWLRLRAWSDVQPVRAWIARRASRQEGTSYSHYHTLTL